MKQHLGETGCYICGRVFSMKHHLKRHLIFVHGIPRDRLARVAPPLPEHLVTPAPVEIGEGETRRS